MSKHKGHQTSGSGFSIVEIIIVIVVVALIAGIVWWVASHRADSQVKRSTEEATKTADAPQGFIWQQTDQGWQSSQTPPKCAAEPMLKAPADLGKATSILYPGQTRGGNYKPHGGFRFDNTPNDQVTVSAPVDGYAVRGGRYLAEGEVQYTFDVMNNCGVMYRVGHLRVLPAKLQALADTWPAPQEGDSRTQEIRPALYIPQGETLATTVGIVKDKNTFFDWGVYDYRQQNEASHESSYQQAHQNDKSLSWYAVCWLQGNWLSATEQARVQSLPAGDPTSGKHSDYCK